jgi:hypothetical protein
MATATLSAEDSKKAEALISAEGNDDEFKDALEEEEIDAQGNFQVTQEELAIVRAELACEFPEDYNYMSDAYILSVASKPYSKDPSIRRPLEVSRFDSILRIRRNATKSPERSSMICFGCFSLSHHITVLYGEIESCNGMARSRRSA